MIKFCLDVKFRLNCNLKDLSHGFPFSLAEFLSQVLEFVPQSSTLALTPSTFHPDQDFVNVTPDILDLETMSSKKRVLLAIEMFFKEL